MAKNDRKNAMSALSSKARGKQRKNRAMDVKYTDIHRAMLSAREELLSSGLPEDPIEVERLITAVRNLDIARVVLECNESLSATDYNMEPWNHLTKMGSLVQGKKKNGSRR
jgi:hypothetical protein